MHPSSHAQALRSYSAHNGSSHCAVKLRGMRVDAYRRSGLYVRSRERNAAVMRMATKTRAFSALSGISSTHPGA